MSKELTLEIMRSYGLQTSTAAVIAFITTASLTAAEEAELKKIVKKFASSTLVLDDVKELQHFYELNEEAFNIPSEKLAMYLKELPEKLDKEKSADGYEELLSIVPVSFLNQYSLVNLIQKTMNEHFWKQRVTNSDNKKWFKEKYGDEAMAALLPDFGSAPVSYEDAKRAYDNSITPQDKILALRYLIALKSSGHMGKDYFDANLSPMPIAEQLENLEKDYKFLDMQENSEEDIPTPAPVIEEETPVEAASKFSDYAYYSLDKDGKVISGWTYKQDAMDDKKESDQEDRKEWKVAKVVHHSRVPKAALETFNKISGYKGNKPPEAEAAASIKGTVFAKEDGFEGEGVYLIRQSDGEVDLMGGPFKSVDIAIDYREDFDKSGYGSDKNDMKAFRLDSTGKVV